MRLAELRATPNALAPRYARFRVGERLLFDSHSHQAWPDVARLGQLEAWDDAAALGGEKWPRAFAKADRVRRGFAELLHDAEGLYALGANTHELVIRFLSALQLAARPRLLATDGEFHTLRRQLARLAEAGFELLRIPAEPVETLAERLAAAVDDRTAAVFVSAVLFRCGRIVRGLGRLMEAASLHGAELLVDTYHALGVVPLSLAEEGLEGAFAVGGGYKYCQLGEGNCFLRIPPGRRFRPVVTGWFSEFTAIADPEGPGPVVYGEGADAFAGATYDPTSHYRASRVFDFFREHALTPGFLREVSQHQVGLLASSFDRLDLPPALVARDRAVALSEIGGFLSLTSPVAAELSCELAAAGVQTDSRGPTLRLGPAPYLADRQIEDAVGILGEVARRRRDQACASCS